MKNIRDENRLIEQSPTLLPRDIIVRAIGVIGVMLGTISFEYVAVYISSFHFTDFPYVVLVVFGGMLFLLQQLFTRIPVETE